MIDRKDDQSVKADAGKPKLTLVPQQIIYDIAAVREYGNRKYPEGGPDNWKTVDAQRYRDAAFRHFLAYIKDPAGLDEESGLPHRWHLECNLAFLAELEEGDFETMTKEEAIGQLEERLDLIKRLYNGCDVEDYAEALEMAIEALNHIADDSKKVSISRGQENDLIERRAVIDDIDEWIEIYGENKCVDAQDILKQAKRSIKRLPSAQPNLSEEYSKAVFTWLMDYQIKVTELKGRYTPYEVLSWVINDWRKENE